MALNRASEVSEANLQSQTHIENYPNFSCVVIWFFSVVENPIKHYSLYNEVQCAIHPDIYVAGQIEPSG